MFVYTHKHPYIFYCYSLLPLLQILSSTLFPVSVFPSSLSLSPSFQTDRQRVPPAARYHSTGVRFLLDWLATRAGQVTNPRPQMLSGDFYSYNLCRGWFLFIYCTYYNDFIYVYFFFILRMPHSKVFCWFFSGLVYIFFAKKKFVSVALSQGKKGGKPLF